MSTTNHDLFGDAAPAASTPLAELLRPKTLDEVIGQQHLLGPGKPLRLAFEARKPHSLIFWGPPGVGKTTLARLMADAFDAEFIALSAVFSGVKDIREAVAQAKAVTRPTNDPETPKSSQIMRAQVALLSAVSAPIDSSEPGRLLSIDAGMRTTGIRKAG